MEVHFVRLLHMALFEKSSVLQQLDLYSNFQQKIGNDDMLLVLIILPMFFAAMHFYLAPFKQRYTHTWQVIVCPILLVPVFMFQNADICILSMFVLTLNLHIAFYHGGGDEMIGEGDSDDSEEEVDMQIHESTWMETMQGMMGQLASSMDMTGVGLMNMAGTVAGSTANYSSRTSNRYD